MEFFSGGGQKISGEILPVVVLNTDGVEEGSLGMVTTFCHHDQAKVEPSEALYTLHQWDSPKLSIVVVKIFANSPYLPPGVFQLPLSGCNHSLIGALTTQFPFDHLCLQQLLPIFQHKLSFHLKWKMKS